jgi:hypothetical protein
LVGPPAATAAEPAFKDWSRQFAIDVCETPSRRAASAIVTSPRNAASTIRTLSSADLDGGRAIGSAYRLAQTLTCLKNLDTGHSAWPLTIGSHPTRSGE